MASKKMDDSTLLEILVSKEDSAGQYVWDTLGSDRERAMRHYHRMPYGTEEEGWSQVVASDVQDSVEWILPDLLDQFLMTDKAVTFDPTRASEVEGAEQATDAVNYVFFKQNPGFLVLYTAIKDALLVRNCAVMWRKQDKETVVSVPFKGASMMMLSMLMAQAGEDAELDHIDAQPQMGPDGQPMLDEFGEPAVMFNGRIKRTEKRKTIKVEAFPPENLIVEEAWTSPLLEECPYVGRMALTTLSDIHEMGFKDVTADDLTEGDESERSADAELRLSKVNSPGSTMVGVTPNDTEDDSMKVGWLRYEWILVDYDGDGIAERREIIRLRRKILSNERCSHVPVATASPILNTHRWDGMSLDDIVNDIQELHTELLRGMLNNLYLSNNPRKKVLVDTNGNPRANMEDLLDSRPGGVLRQYVPDAITDDVTPFAAAATMPVLEYVQGMRENRTGVSRTSMGLDPDSLNTTATGRRMDKTSSQKRVKLIARVFAEILLKPTFQGILKLLTEGDMEAIAFKLRGKFVEYDPNNWRDQYDTSTNVGLGTGDQEAQARSLQTVMQSQLALMQYGLVTPMHLYHTETKLIENAGFKDVENFVQPPQPKDPNKPEPPPLPLQIEQMKIQGQLASEEKAAQLKDKQHEREMQRDVAAENMKQEAQAREAQHTADLTHQLKMAQEAENTKRLGMELDHKWYVEQLKAQTAIYVALVSKPPEAPGGPEEPAEGAGQDDGTKDALRASIEALTAIVGNINQPKMIIKDEMGRPIGVGPMQGAQA